MRNLWTYTLTIVATGKTRRIEVEHRASLLMNLPS
jgi:hypothetical protein